MVGSRRGSRMSCISGTGQQSQAPHMSALNIIAFGGNVFACFCFVDVQTVPTERFQSTLASLPFLAVLFSPLGLAAARQEKRETSPIFGSRQEKRTLNESVDTN